MPSKPLPGLPQPKDAHSWNRAPAPTRGLTGTSSGTAAPALPSCGVRAGTSGGSASPPVAGCGEEPRGAERGPLDAPAPRGRVSPPSGRTGPTRQGAGDYSHRLCSAGARMGHRWREAPKALWRPQDTKGAQRGAGMCSGAQGGRRAPGGAATACHNCALWGPRAAPSTRSTWPGPEGP